jgi:hypothetical protein
LLDIDGSNRSNGPRVCTTSNHKLEQPSNIKTLRTEINIHLKSQSNDIPLILSAIPSYATEIIHAPPLEITILVPWSQALLTPVIAATGIFVSWRQWKTNSQKLRYDLFEKRYAIYEAAVRFIASMMREGRPSREAQNAYLVGTQGAKLLFGKEVEEYLHLLWVDAVEMEMHQAIFSDLPVSEKRSEHVEAAAAIKKKLPDHFKSLDEKLFPYINLASIR